ncbi:suppressor of SWI4 1 homolog, partial [Columba livia]
SKHQKKERAAARHQAQQDFATVPHSFVFHRGRGGRNLRQLVGDVRKVMEPFTARALKVRKNNSLKDFVAVAGPLGVTHFLVFSKSSSSINFVSSDPPTHPLGFGGSPSGTFLGGYSLIKDVVSSLKRHRMHEQQFTHHPLLVLSNFGLQQIQVKVMASMFQNMFPSINVHRVNLNNIKRCLLIAYNAETQQLDFRHYSVKVVPVGVSKGLKKLLQEKFPNMSRLEDISELLVKDINLSESEAEQDGTHNTLELPQAYAGRGNMKAQQSAVRLTEIGPRMTLQLVKVEEGLAQGNVLYHSFGEHRETPGRELAGGRTAASHPLSREKSLAGMRRKRQQDGDSDAEDPGAPEQPEAAEHSESDNDAEYYREEVGEEPDKDLFPKRKRSSSGAAPLRKRRRRSRPEDPDLYLHPKSPAGTWDPCLHPKSSVCTPRSLPAPPDLYLHPRSPAGTWDPCLHPKIPACTPGVLSLPAPQESCVHPKIPACAPTVLPAPPDLYLHPKIPACTWDLYLHPEIQWLRLLLPPGAQRAPLLPVAAVFSRVLLPAQGLALRRGAVQARALPLQLQPLRRHLLPRLHQPQPLPRHRAPAADARAAAPPGRPFPPHRRLLRRGSPHRLAQPSPRPGGEAQSGVVGGCRDGSLRLFLPPVPRFPEPQPAAAFAGTR